MAACKREIAVAQYCGEPLEACAEVILFVNFVKEQSDWAPSHAGDLSPSCFSSEAWMGPVVVGQAA